MFFFSFSLSNVYIYLHDVYFLSFDIKRKAGVSYTYGCYFERHPRNGLSSVTLSLCFMNGSFAE